MSSTPPRCHRLHGGFTLIETAIVVVVLALLIGGILKGWELIQSSRVKTVGSTATAVQSAYFAFHDRYGHVAGDWNAAAAAIAIGEPVTGGGNDSGHIDTTPGAPWTESNAFWEQLAKAGFIHGTFPGTVGEPDVGNGFVPLNVSQRPMLIGRTQDFEGATAPRRHIVVGRGLPMGLMRELDVKLDDGQPHLGKFRATVDEGAVTVFDGTHKWGGREAGCVNAVPDWDASVDAQDCNGVLIF